MAELIRRKFNWSSLSRLEQLALVGSVLIWTGVAVFGGGLYVAFRSLNVERQAHAQATAIVRAPTETITSTPTTVVFPVGWATATPTVTRPPTATPVATPTTEGVPASEPEGQSPGSALRPAPTAADLQPAKAPQEPAVPPAPPPASAPPDRIVIPAIGLDSGIVPIGWYVVEEGDLRYSVWQVADYAVSWHKTSAYPGHSGNVVLNGHHNIKGEVFRYLVDLEAGDRLILYVGDEVYHYAVEQKMILKEKGESADVRRQNASWIAPTTDERLTMVTCWPYTNNTHRLVVVAKPAPAPRAEGLQE